MSVNPIKVKQLYWQKKLSAIEIAKKLDISAWAVYDFMRKNSIPRRAPAEVNYLNNKTKPGFLPITPRNNSDRSLKVAGIMLYWAEGTFNGNTVDFANSDPAMIKVFLLFLRKICGVNEQRLRVYLYGYSSQNINVLKNFWSCVTKIPTVQFTKPYIRSDSPNLSQRKLPYGLVHIRYNDKKLLFSIQSWLECYLQDVIGAGTQVAKGDRLSKGSVMLKSMMEK